MKLSCVSLVLLLTQTNAFVSQKVSSSGGHLMAEKEDNQGWWAPASAAVFGWTLATQVAFGITAVTPEQNAAPQPFQTNPSTVLAGFGSNVETMDFSLPSYGDSVKSPFPSFNPFGDVKDAPEEVSKPDSAADEKAAAEAKKEEEKAAAEAKKEEEKAAAEAKKAEKEARKLAEKEKQRLAVERANQEKASQSVEEEAPVEMKIPDISVPEIKVPEVPDIKVPEIKVPDIKLPSFSMPKVEMPKVDLPKNVDLPKVPEVSIPKFDTSKLPAVSLPKLDYDFNAPTEDGEEIEPQEVRDERAREARNVYLTADETAKDVERQALELRALANDKKQLAKEAKDEACKTRIGGKWICLRGFNLGY